MSDTDTPTGPGPAPFGVRLDAATLARLDAYAERIDKKRGGAAARVIAAGLDALEGLPVRALANPSREVSPGPALDVDALADALIDRLPAPTVRRVEPPDSGAIAAGIVLAMRDPVTRAAIVAELAAAGVTARAPAPPVAAELPAEGARIDPATLRGVGGERRRNPPERRDPAPREDAPGRRLADGLRAARDARGTEGRPLTQRDAAAAARVPLATYQRAEQGKDVRESTRAALTAWIGEG